MCILFMGVGKCTSVRQVPTFDVIGCLAQYTVALGLRDQLL